jgi:hypothetical protein
MHQQQSSPHAATNYEGEAPSLVYPCVLTAAFAVNCVCSYVASATGPSNADISNKYYTLLTPPGWAFAVWGVIFISEGIACFASFLPAVRRFACNLLDCQFAGLWVGVCALQTIWAFTFAHSVSAAAGILIAEWVLLVALQRKSFWSLSTTELPEASFARIVGLYAAYIAPFSLHAGWVTAAAALNVNLAAVEHETHIPGQAAIAVGSLVVLGLCTWIFGAGGLPSGHRCADVALAAGLIWALAGIANRSCDVPEAAVEAAIRDDCGVLSETLRRSAIFVAALAGAALLFVGIPASVVNIRRLRNAAEFIARSNSSGYVDVADADTAVIRRPAYADDALQNHAVPLRETGKGSSDVAVPLDSTTHLG